MVFPSEEVSLPGERFPTRENGPHPLWIRITPPIIHILDENKGILDLTGESKTDMMFDQELIKVTMDQIISVVGITVFIVALILLGIVVYLKLEKNRKRELSQNFREFIKEQDLTYKDLRAVPRMLIPESLEVFLKFNEQHLTGKQADVIDISMGGVATRLNFPVRKIELNSHFNNVRVETPINSFMIKTLRSVRMEPQIERRMMAFQIIDIDEDQFDELKRFMAYLNRFLKNED